MTTSNIMKIQKISDKLSDFKEALEMIRDEESDNFDGMSEDMKDEYSESAESVINNLEEAISMVEEAMKFLDASLD